MVRPLIPLVLAAAALGCTPSRAQIVRTVGYGLAIEAGAVFTAAYVAQSPRQGIGDAATIAAPLVVAGIVEIVLGHAWPHHPEPPRYPSAQRPQPKRTTPLGAAARPRAVMNHVQGGAGVRVQVEGRRQGQRGDELSGM